MTPVDPLAAFLATLLRDGRVPSSQVPASVLRRLGTLRDVGAISDERAGSGRAVVALSRPRIEAFIQAEYPNGLHWDPSAPTRSDASFFTRDSKRGKVPANLVVIKAFNGMLRFPNGHTQDLAAASQAAGCYAFILGEESAPMLVGLTQLVVVENFEAFLQFEQLAPSASLAIFAAGRLSERSLRWLTGPDHDSILIEHAGDYDPVGLSEYDRLYRARDGKNVRLVVPRELEAAFKSSKASLLDLQQRKHLAAMLTHPDQACRHVARLIAEHGGGVEQEIFLTPGVAEAGSPA
ncbi:MAG: hypothetical protein E6Q76_08180 [Rhizobium sp.]|nr:MAG: hypothetical protein E6Q76_08180 [Rhizobium sp.]